MQIDSALVGMSTRAIDQSSSGTEASAVPTDTSTADTACSTLAS
ncbi:MULTISPECIES: hypothetical protein [Sphingobacterium]|nr:MULTISPECIES: hypothetical protein [unclassified Sphingobacterium]